MTADIRFLSTVPILASLDITRSVAFFCEKLGFTKLFLEQGVYDVVGRGEVSIHFWACSDKRIAEQTGCRVRVEGIDRLYDDCLALGIVHPNEPLESKPWGSREFAILDPDGNCVTFNEHATPSS